MTTHERKISPEIYERAKANSNYITEDDMKTVFDDSERLGYGVYSPCVYECNGEHYVLYHLGSSCD